MFFSTNRTYRQNPSEVAYQPNSDTTQWNLKVRAWDGNFIYGCGPSSTFFSPSLPCPLGATGYMVAGDADGDGQRDDFSYYEIVSLVPGVAFEPNQPERCSLYSAPPSDLPRPVGAFTDLTFTVFYNLMDATKPQRMYKLPHYSLQLDYTDRGTMDNEVVTGLYRFSFPKLGSPETPAQLPVTYYPIPEGYKRNSSIWQGFRFTKLNGKPLAYDAAGFIGIDPRLPNTFTWAGNTADIIFPGTDKLYVAMSDLATAANGAPLGNPKGAIDPVKPTIYPGFSGGSKTSRVQLLTPLVTEVVIPPGFVVPPFPVPVAPAKTAPAREAVLRVMLARLVPSSSVCYDNSSRAYELPIRFINTYEGWAAVAFPPGTPASKRASTANPDGDPYNNYIEWRNWVVGSSLGGTVPLKPNPMVKDVITPPILTLVQVQPRPTRSTASVGTSHWETKHPKDPAFTYVYEFSTDLQHWTVVDADHPEWQVSETDTEIKCQSKRETLSGNGFLRVRETPAPVQASTVE